MKNHYTVVKDERGVSEAIGFLLIFSLVVVGIGLVSLYGYPVLLQQQVSADQRIMEKNMIVLQNDIKSLTYKNVPYKETSLKVGGGPLTVYNTSFTPRSSFKIIDGISVDETFYPGQLQYVSVGSQQVIVIENGAVMGRRELEAGSFMLAEPRWFIDTDPVSAKTTAVLYLIGMNSTELLSRTGVGTVKMQMAETNYTEYIAPSNPITVQYIPNPNNDFSVAWRNYFVNTLKWTETGPGTGTYQPPPPPIDTLVIKRYDIMVKSL
jgi:hypothetical protein